MIKLITLKKKFPLYSDDRTPISLKAIEIFINAPDTQQCLDVKMTIGCFISTLEFTKSQTLIAVACLKFKMGGLGFLHTQHEIFLNGKRSLAMEKLLLD
jgi:hypothetical protein